MNHVLHQIDAFTDTAFQGNPAAVCLLDSAAEKDWMQDVAQEMNLSETAFLFRQDDGDWSLRWFTPGAEVDLCGHATLASAHFLWDQELLDRAKAARFHTRSGLLTCVREDDWIVMDFPALPIEPAEEPAGLAAALGAQPVATWRSTWDLVAEFADAQAVRRLAPDFRALLPFAERGVLVTAPGDDGYDFVSRFFAPVHRIDEDPVTGSTHCILTPFWGARLKKKQMLAFQASRRGGVLRVATNGDRVKLGGKAVTVLRGALSC
ncbi:MAG: PhzF family phenazine biosynthesis protein [Proteobacteria bacterium]|nr:PhzF family phenazine biosynthesis protein [Pseudomonadota bacterium]MDA1058323.1 PhzF family phenazine biosynthesis protein [Pseudomonadota bacterium]